MIRETARKTPRVRFKGFVEPWEQKRLGELYTERNERGNDLLQILSVSIHSGVSNGELDSDSLGKQVRRSEDKSLYKHVYAGDLVFNMMRAWQGAIGVAVNEGMVSPAYITAVPNETIYPPFMDFGLRRSQIVAQMNTLSYGVTDFRKRLYWDSFIRVVVNISSVSEQRKITDYLSHLDDLITLHRRKHDKLVALKQAMLQKMFPQEGAITPEIRFSGFCVDWKARPLRQLATFSKGRGYSKKDLVDVGTPIILYGRLYTAYQTEIGDVDTFVCADSCSVMSRGNEVVVPASGETAEDIARASAVIRKGVILGGDLNIISPCDDLDSTFLALSLSNGEPKRNLARKAQGKSVVHLRNSDLEPLSFYFPELSEQKRIAKYFRELDELVSKHALQLEKLRNIKSACLEKMFV
jgi:type I restriction enzyme S subunit